MDMTRSKLTLALTAALGLLLGNAAQAAGYQVFPTASSGARLLAGNGILGEEAGDMYFNAAGLALQPAGSTVQIGGSWLKLETEFTDLGSHRVVIVPPNRRVVLPMLGNTIKAEDTATPIGNFFVRRSRSSEALTWGFGVTSPYGVVIDYDPGWVGRYQAVTSDLKVLDFNGAVAWRIDEKFTIGAGISAQYVDATLSQAAPTPAGPDVLLEVEGDGVGYGANVGLMYQANPEWRLGASYRSMVSHEIEGERNTLAGGSRIAQVGARTNVHIPEFALLSALYAPAEQRWSLAAGLRYTKWSRFEEFRVDFADGTSSVIPEGWENSWTGSVSADYRLTPRDKLIVAYSYDASPVPNAELRSARIPDTHRNIVGLGYERQETFCESCVLYLSYHRTMLGESAIDREEALSPAFSTRLSGRYEEAATDVFAAHFIFRF